MAYHPMEYRMLTLLLLSLTSANAMPLDVTGVLPKNPGTVTMFAPTTSGSVTPIDLLQDTFGLSGITYLDGEMGGISRVRDGSLSAFAWEQGGAMFMDLSVLKSQTPIRARSENELYVAADSLLDELGLYSVPGIELVAGHANWATLQITDAQGRVHSSVITHEKASFQQVIDGLPGFGGAEVDVVYGRNGQVAMVQHAVRALEEVGTAKIMAPEQAVANLGLRADSGAPYNLFLIAMGSVGHVEVTSVELGYYVPDVAQVFDLYEPVWEIRGVVHGESVRGEPMEADLLWYEPAVAGHDLLPLNIPAIQ